MSDSLLTSHPNFFNKHKLEIYILDVLFIRFIFLFLIYLMIYLLQFQIIFWDSLFSYLESDSRSSFSLYFSSSIFFLFSLLSCIGCEVPHLLYPSQLVSNWQSFIWTTRETLLLKALLANNSILHISPSWGDREMWAGWISLFSR